MVLASLPVTGLSLSDFYACYAPEDDLPESEHCRTGMSSMFDPCGWFVYYENPDYSLWPEPPKTE